MPNHITNEIIFRGVDEMTKGRILIRATNDKGEVDFERLLPVPLNVWRGNVGINHKKAFREENTGLNWAMQNWGTKWNAYQHRPIIYDEGVLTIVFDTAWRPPYGWLVAMYNHLGLGFEHNWLDEGCERGVSGRFLPNVYNDFRVQEWEEKPCSDEMQKHLHFLKWGVEEFEDED